MDINMQPSTLNSDIKVVYFTQQLRKSSASGARAPAHSPAPPIKKVITATQKWSSVKSADLSPERQIELLQNARKFYCGEGAAGEVPEKYGLIIDHIKQKIGGYRAQDQAKDKYCAADFVDIARVFELLISCNMECHYCKKPVMLLYEYVREPRQWSLDRIDNSRGHVRDNLYVACLTCNLRRRTIKPERYELTKKCVQIRREGLEDPQVITTI